MSYALKEMHYTLQGEGHHTGRPAILVRFSGCNLWSGREEDRPGAICRFCDTDFVGTDGPGGGEYESATDVVREADRLWPEAHQSNRFVVCTGGEPLLQLDHELVDAFHRSGFELAVETNGVLLPPDGVDWTCTSPKAGAELRVRSGNELKLVFPQTGVDPQDYVHLEFDHRYLQPLAGPRQEENTKAAVDYCLAHPRWSLSLQIHKILNIP